MPWPTRSQKPATPGVLGLSGSADSAYAAAAVASAAADDLIELTDDYLTAWLKVAADEGCLIPDEADAEYLAFLAALDFMEGSQANGG